MTVYTQISQNNWPSTKNQFDDYLVLACPFNAKQGLTDVGVTVGSKKIIQSKTLSTNGTPSITTAQSQYYGSSAFLDGSGDYLQIESNSAFAFGTGDFCVEAWVRPTTTSNYTGIFVTAPPGTYNETTLAVTINNNTLRVTNWSSEFLSTSSNSVPSNTWTHIACVRQGTTMSSYINGAAGPSASNSVNFTQNGITIGRNVSFDFAGYIQDLRIYKGVAKYTGAFTPPGPILGSA